MYYLIYRYEEVKINVKGIFKGVNDRFNGITVDSNEENCDNIDNFKQALDSKYKISFSSIT